MALIKTAALRDRRPKTEPIEVETTQGNVITFVSPLKKKARAGMEALAKMNSANSREDVTQIFEALAANGVEDMDTIIEDDDPELGDLLDIVKEVGKEIQNQAGSTVGESKA